MKADEDKNEGMLNFAAGPVMSSDIVRQIGARQAPYFRTDEFSKIMLENERLMKKFAGAHKDARAVFITGSGTAAMEAAVINAFDKNDKVLIVNGGSFGKRFADICRVYDIPHEEIRLGYGRDLKEDVLSGYGGQGFTGLLVNIHETSTGVHYDIDMLGRFARENNLLFVVDAVSSFLADRLDMQESAVDIMLTGSQKALACPPGICVIVLSQRAIKRIGQVNVKCFYLNILNALKNGVRGQTPFTPAVGILLQINARLKEIDENGGAAEEQRRVGALAEDFRERIKGLPLEIFPETPSNAVTALHPVNVPARSVFDILKDEYHIWVCPNGGDLTDKIFRVGHMGALTKEDNTILINALKDLVRRGLL